jgi:hypothetical protein
MTDPTTDTASAIAAAGTTAAAPPPIPAAPPAPAVPAAAAAPVANPKVDAAIAALTADKNSVTTKIDEVIAAFEALPGEISHTLKIAMQQLTTAKNFVIGHFDGVANAVKADGGAATVEANKIADAAKAYLSK